MSYTNLTKPSVGTFTDLAKPSQNIEYLVTEALNYLMTEDGDYIITNQSSIWTRITKAVASVWTTLTK